jgi:TnpA family transposase
VDAATRYKHIDRLFSETVDWELIGRHWQDLMQVALSIQAGAISSPLLLRRFGSESRKTACSWRPRSSARSFARYSCSNGSAAANCARRSPPHQQDRVL